MHRYDDDYEEALGGGERRAVRWKHMTPKTKKKDTQEQSRGSCLVRPRQVFRKGKWAPTVRKKWARGDFVSLF